MSDLSLQLIPTDPQFVPSTVARRKAMELLRGLLPDVDEVEEIVTDEIEFIDCAENFERVSCPACGAELDLEWWQEAVDSAAEEHFKNLAVTLPCCNATASLNDLKYEAPQGFARYCLEAMNPSVSAIPAADVARLEAALGCKLRTIWADV
jgi:hypothetical protein